MGMNPAMGFTAAKECSTLNHATLVAIQTLCLILMQPIVQPSEA
jgi:hypothetical protein